MDCNEVKIESCEDIRGERQHQVKLPHNFVELLNEEEPKQIIISGETYCSFAKSKRGKNDETKQLSNILKRKLSNYFDSIARKLTKFEKQRLEILKKDKACLKAFRTFYGVGVEGAPEEAESFQRLRKLSKEFFSSNEFLREILTSPYLKNRKAVLKYLPIIEQAPLHPEKFTSWKKFEDDQEKPEKG
jgi:hypothetical protein